MASITTRAGKGSPLTNAEVDANFDNLNTGKLELSGGTMTGALTLNANPTQVLHAASKQYVDALIASGIHFHSPVRVEAPLNLNVTYNNGTAGVGATLTNAGTQAALVLDGVTVSVADRVLVYEQTNQTQNGVYVVTDVGSGSTNWVLTRSSDTNTYVINNANGLSEGSTFFVQQGTTGAGETYTCNTSGTITFGTTNISFAQISAAQIYSAGTGLTLSGTQFAVAAAQLLPTQSGNNGKFLTTNGTATSWAVLTAPNNGTLTLTVAGTGLSGSASFTADQSGNATFTVTSNATSANTVGAIVARDGSGNFAAGTITATLSGNATNVSGTVAIANGGTGETTRQAAMDALAGAVTSGSYLRGNGTDVVMNTIQAADVPTLNQNTTGSAATLTTARTINGTSFNGSANITITANTTNTLTLGTGLTGSSFNGSGAVTATVSYGTSSGTACQGNDSRLSDSRQATNSNTQLASLGVGTGASGTAGEIRATNNITAYYSDDRLKTKLGNIEDALAKIRTLNGFYYEANETAQALGYEAVREVGVSAQQVQAVQPEIVVPAPIDDKYLTVRYERLVPLLIEAVKELDSEFTKRIVEQDAKIARLEKLVAKLIEG